MADNGALKEGDSPDASRHEPPRLRFAAQHLLLLLYADQGGYAIRPDSELLRMMAIPIRVREDMVHRIANYRGVSQPVDRQNDFTVQQIDFEWALAQWKKEFPMAQRTMAPLKHSYNKTA